jgi:Flp pilus assembly pilin Flp
MQHLLKKLFEQFSLDTEDGAAAVEYAVIVGLVVWGLLDWYMNRSH